MIDWNPYLESICQKYAQWWMTYTLTDVAGKTRPPKTAPLLTDLRVQTIAPPRANREENEEKPEYLLEGLQKYARDHVLLRGRPGSGKSTALARLLFEKAEESKSLLANHPNPSKIIQIPILVELRRYKTSIVALIRKFLQRHELEIDKNTLRNFLRGKNPIIPLLLFDGINELPSGEARYDLQEFRQDPKHARIPMIFTTRDLAIGGELNIEKKLEILPLTEEQMREFIRAYLPENGERMLTQLGNRLREFGKTPLLLWMLCWVFENKKQIPANLGLVFRDFTEDFDRYKREKEGIRISDDLRRLYDQLLQHLAWRMTKGEKENPTEIKLSISKRKAQDILTDFLQKIKVSCPEITALEWLEELLKYYLIQVTPDKRGIEFPHQLIQEYYTAEALLQRLDPLNDEELPRLTDEELKWNYLNYLKWTEPIALMLGMLPNEADAIRVVKLALEVDFRLGARLAGEVNADWHKNTVDYIIKLNLSQLITIDLLGKTRSSEAISHLFQTLESSDCHVRVRSVEALSEIGTPVVISKLHEILLEDRDSKVRESAVQALDKIGSPEIIIILIEALESSETNLDVRFQIIQALEHSGSPDAIPVLINTLNKYERTIDDSIIDDYIIYALEYIGESYSELVIKEISKILTSFDAHNRYLATKVLSKIDSQTAQEKLYEALKDPDEYVRWIAASSLLKIKQDFPMNWCLSIGEDRESRVFKKLNKKLEEINLEAEKIDYLIQSLKSSEDLTCIHAIKNLKGFASEKVILALIEATENPNDKVCCEAISALGEIASIVSIPTLIKALKHPVRIVRRDAVRALASIGSNETIPEMIKSLEDCEQDVRRTTAQALIKMNSELTLSALLDALKNPIFATINNGDTLDKAHEAISTIQNKLKYYRPIPESIHQQIQPTPSTNNASSITIVQTFNEKVYGVAGNVEGNLQINPDSATTEIDPNAHP